MEAAKMPKRNNGRKRKKRLIEKRMLVHSASYLLHMYVHVRLCPDNNFAHMSMIVWKKSVSVQGLY